jgi:alpha-beta hydrolase superfamily lysophospholipase
LTCVLLAGAHAFLGGCAARSAAPAADVTTQTAADLHRRASEDLLGALKAREYDRVVAHFGQHLKSSLPKEKLATEVWLPLTTSFGELQSWTLTSRDSPSGKDRLRYRLVHERGSLDATIVFDPDTSDVVGIFFHRNGHARTAPAAPVSDPNVRGTETLVGDGPDALPAYVTLPVVPATRKGGYPGVVLVPGSGPQDMDETFGAAKPFRDLAEGLSRRGIAVLRFDKRTFANAARFDAEKATIDNEQIDDALAAVRQMRSMPEVDPNHICVVGHSLGALVSPEIAYRSGAGIACVVLMSPPGRSLPELLVDQMKRKQFPATTVNDLESQLKLLLAGKLSSRDKFAGINVSYWMSLLSRDEMAIAKKLAKPILVVRGDADDQVTEVDQHMWEQALVGVPNARSVTLKGLNHLFLRGSPKAPEASPSDTHMDDAVILLISSFVLGNTAS